ncbi:MAG: DUF5698 domain-containing protein [Anaerolineaceae bacterium]|jgi:uncharacterized protein YebE (UPF0316 family)|nr:DUF5698 domain-containing protein [Anaerolineaceae bacterium]
MDEILSTVLFSQPLWVGTLFIFLMRVVNISTDTVRLLFMIQRRKVVVWILGFVQSILYVLVIGSVLSQLDNFWFLLAYASGYSTGTSLGMWIEERLALGYLQVTIISPSLGTAIAENLRNEGFAVTEIPARGKDGMVSILHSSVIRKDLHLVETIAMEADPKAFVTTETVRPVRAGFWRKK